jgi:methionyl-tRNA formyltransferase
MKVFVLTPPELGTFAQKALAPFESSTTHRLCGCAVDGRPPRPTGERLRAHLRRGRGGYMVVMAANRRRRRRAPTLPAAEFCRRNRIALIETDEPYSAETLEAIRAHSPDVLVLIGGFGILKQPLLELAPHGVLSYHHGDMRRYRGQPPGLWELYNGEHEMGVTVQRLGATVDAGEPIIERTVPIERRDTVRSLQARASERSAEMLYEAVCRLEDPNFRSERIEQFGLVYTLPNLRQWLRLNARIAIRRLPIARHDSR